MVHSVYYQQLENQQPATGAQRPTTMPNQVTRRVYDYLKDIPPFSFVDNEEALMRVAGRVEVQYQPIGSLIFRGDEPPRERFFVIKEGAVEILQIEGEEEQLIERHGEGEVFGIRPLLAEEDYLFSARAAEETLLYAINTEGFRELLSNYPRLTQYLATSMAGGYHRKNRPTKPVASTGDAHLLELQTVHQPRPAITCEASARIVEAARSMAEHNVGSIVIIDKMDRPLGIITDRDLRQQVATGKVSNMELVGSIMQGPVICEKPDSTLADIQITMVSHGINHIVLTKDGSDQSAVVGVVSKHDVLVLQGNNPAVLVREIGRAKSAIYLRTLRERAEGLLEVYLAKEVSISFITTIMTRINDEIIRKCIKLGLAQMQADGRGNPPALFDWLALGSQGRGEQLLRTDQDSALIFEDVPENRYNLVKDYFLQLAGYVTEYLNDVGFAYCPGDMMASNPAWCLPVSKWKDQFSHWMHENTAESMLHTSIFFDYRGVWGDG
ncbi:MAG: DUF294 nucleotidyltransferase-like domain-containing protein, partial [Bacteroidota bacterium]